MTAGQQAGAPRGVEQRAQAGDQAPQGARRAQQAVGALHEPGAVQRYAGGPGVRPVGGHERHPRLQRQAVEGHIFQIAAPLSLVRGDDYDYGLQRKLQVRRPERRCPSLLCQM